MTHVSPFAEVIYDSARCLTKRYSWATMGHMPQPGSSVKGASRRAEILEAAWTYLAAVGYNGTSLREISRSIGLDAAHVLYYFESRERLLMAVLEHWDAACWRHAQHGTDGDRIEIFIRAVQRNAEIPGIVQLYLSFAAEASVQTHPAHEYFSARFRRIREGLRDAVEVRRAAGTISQNVDPNSLAQHLIALADGLQLQALLTPDVDVVKELRGAVNDASVPREAFSRNP